MPGNAENAESLCEQRTESNQHPSTGVEGLVEGVKWFNPGSLQAREHESVLEKRFERRGKETPFLDFRQDTPRRARQRLFPFVCNGFIGLHLRTIRNTLRHTLTDRKSVVEGKSGELG